MIQQFMLQDAAVERDKGEHHLFYPHVASFTGLVDQPEDKIEDNENFIANLAKAKGTERMDTQQYNTCTV